ncbi:MAG: 16S rRNA (cytosine(1402)-N(4))-methyltransferase RsmH, partial [Actinomycetes bacterium]
DLGVSSPQLDVAERGFSYRVEAPLDMRMDRSQVLTAADVVNTYDRDDIARILRDNADERFARRVADAIVAARPLSTTSQLAATVTAAIPAATRRRGGHPAKRTFQALRIEVNGELEVLRAAIPAALDSLSLGGRIVVMSYQSLEDRIVKQAFAEGAESKAPHDLPVVPESMKPWLRLITRGAEMASESEIESNPRAASVRVRAAERVAVAA